MSKFYLIDPDDPDSPKPVEEYRGLKPGDHVRYENPAWQMPDGSFKTGGMDPPLVISELVAWELNGEGTTVEAVLNDGQWECNADNLVLDQ